ncbi:hypothetical protein [Enterococcus sp. 2201sp1_2201st1_B8_2201SCRN_220225]|uniref:hypothetical protein n=1 Tax=unclassified Enterococcus TaxID=2608891 RepID=UPI0034A29CBE
MFSIGIVLAGLVTVKACKEKSFLFDTKQKMLMGFLLFIVAVSFYVNKDIMADPRNANISSNLLQNFELPLFSLFFGICFVMPKALKRLLLAFGFFTFGYLALHYLIGFHNPYWLNLDLPVNFGFWRLLNII